MIQIRKSVFETNSSSTHSICITEVPYTGSFPDYLEFRLGEFHWQEEELITPQSKASYFYTALVLRCVNTNKLDELDDAIKRIETILSSVNVKCEFEKPIFEKWDKYTYCTNASIDHSDEHELALFVEETLNTDGQLIRYLFSYQSYVLTGNDSDETDVSIDEDYPHIEYYKDN